MLSSIRQKKMKEKEVIFDVGDEVWVYFKAQTTDKTLSVKFLANWKGPYVVIERIHSVNYRVKEFDSEKNQIVHVSRMRKYRPWIGNSASERDQN